MKNQGAEEYFSNRSVSIIELPTYDDKFIVSNNFLSKEILGAQKGWSQVTYEFFLPIIWKISLVLRKNKLSLIF